MLNSQLRVKFLLHSVGRFLGCSLIGTRMRYLQRTFGWRAVHAAWATSWQEILLLGRLAPDESVCATRQIF